MPKVCRFSAPWSFPATDDWTRHDGLCRPTSKLIELSFSTLFCSTLYVSLNLLLLLWFRNVRVSLAGSSVLTPFNKTKNVSQDNIRS